MAVSMSVYITDSCNTVSLYTLVVHGMVHTHRYTDLFGVTLYRGELLFAFTSLILGLVDVLF